MPAVAAFAVAAIGAVAGGVQTVAALAGLTTTLAGGLALKAAVTTLIYNGIAGAAVSALFPPPEVRSASASPITWQADPDAGIPFIAGRRGVAGQIVHRGVWGPDNRYMGAVTVYSGAGPINAFSTIKLDDVTYTFNASTGACTSPSGKPNRIWFTTKLGAQPDTALASPSGLEGGGSGIPNWGSDYKLSGKACSMITYRQNGEMTYWPTGEAKPLIVVQGIKVYDPRLDSTYPGGSGSCRLNDRSTWIYSTNPGIHALNWALGMKENGKLVGGIGASFAKIDVPAFVDVANTADVNGWTCSAVAYSTDDKFQVLQAYLQAAGAIPSRKQGKISCINIAAPKTSVVTITVEDTAGAFELDAGSPRTGRINTITPRCVQEDSAWQMVDLEPITSSTYVTEDGGATRSRRIDYPFVSDEDQAAQLAAYDIANSREGLSGEILLKPYMRELEPGDAFTIDEPGFVLDGQKFLVLRRSYDPASDVVRITFRSETDAKHAWATGETGTAPPSPSLTPVQPDDVPTPDAADWSVAPGAGAVPSLVLTGEAPAATVNVGKVVIQYREDGATDWRAWGEVDASAPITAEIVPQLGGADYEVGIAYRNGFGYLGETLALAPATTPALTADTATLADAIVGQGDLATENDVDWTSQVASRPPELTDGRIAAGLNASGEVQPDKVDTAAIQVGAVVETTEVQTLGQTTIVNGNATAPADRSLICSVSHTVTDGAVVVVDFRFQFDLANGDAMWLYAKMDGASTATWAKTGGRGYMSNADQTGRLQFNANDHGSYSLVVEYEGVAPGVHTFDLYGNQGGGSSHKFEDPMGIVTEYKRAA